MWYKKNGITSHKCSRNDSIRQYKKARASLGKGWPSCTGSATSAGGGLGPAWCARGRSAGAASGGNGEQEPSVAACGQRRAWAVSGGGRGLFGAWKGSLVLCLRLCIYTLHSPHTKQRSFSEIHKIKIFIRYLPVTNYITI